MKTIRNVSIRRECSLFTQDIINVTFENCLFDHLILSDLHLEKVRFIDCKFDHVFLESFYASNVSILKSKILSLSLRGNRKITSKKLFGSIKDRRIEKVDFDDTSILELVLGGDLQVVNCDFPEGDNYLHFKNPFLVYSKCLQHIEEHWEGEKRRIATIVMHDCLSKEVKNQNEDFITFSQNEYLEKETNEIFKSVFSLIKEVSTSIDQ